MKIKYPKEIGSYVNGLEILKTTAGSIKKFNPATGRDSAIIITADNFEIERAVRLAEVAQNEFQKKPVLRRAQILREAALFIRNRREELAEIVAFECGKSVKSSLGEIDAAFECGMFFAGEGVRYRGEGLQSANPNRKVELVREPIGV